MIKRSLLFLSLMFIFIIASNLYCFDLFDDAFDFDIIEDIAKIIGMGVMILAVMYFIKKFLRDERNSRVRHYHEDDHRNKMHNNDNNNKKCYDIKAENLPNNLPTNLPSNIKDDEK